MAANLKLDLNYLVKEELMYESQIRGLGVGVDLTVDQLRKVLRNAIKLEKTSLAIKYPVYPFTFAVDSAAVLANVNEINQLLDTFEGIENDSSYRKICSKIAHSVGRINKAKPSSVEDQTLKTDLNLKLLLAFDNLKDKAKQDKKKETILDLSVLTKSLAGPKAHSSRVSSTDSDSDSDIRIAPRKAVPVRDWGLKFTGEKNSMSLSQFLERVEELRKPRGISRKVLFDEAIDLFDGDARRWYNFVKEWATDWESLIELMREQFQASGYDRKLFEEIKQRTQGVDESIGMYLACMNGLFNRLKTPVPEETKLEILWENIDPYYHPHLTFHTINSVSQLLIKCRKLDDSRDKSRKYVPPPRKNKVLEPDLAYVEHDQFSPSTSRDLREDRLAQGSYQESRSVNSRPVRKVDDIRPNRSVICWNCQEGGHVSTKCPKPKTKKFCYRCGHTDVTLRSCPKCNKSSGNGQARR
uniref:CCHC-type domain-containing protein n=1 Tax=Anoplophora glabripennis TaxID=217634 RepID=V5IA64_ANOGL